MSSFAAQFLIPSPAAAPKPGGGAPAPGGRDGAFAALVNTPATSGPAPRPSAVQAGVVDVAVDGQTNAPGSDFDTPLRALRVDQDQADADSVAVQTPPVTGPAENAPSLAGRPAQSGPSAMIGAGASLPAASNGLPLTLAGARADTAGTKGGFGAAAPAGSDISAKNSPAQALDSSARWPAADVTGAGQSAASSPGTAAPGSAGTAPAKPQAGPGDVEGQGPATSTPPPASGLLSETSSVVPAGAERAVLKQPAAPPVTHEAMQGGRDAAAKTDMTPAPAFIDGTDVAVKPDSAAKRAAPAPLAAAMAAGDPATVRAVETPASKPSGAVPAEAGAAAASEAAAFKRTGIEAALEPLVRAERAASDLAAARAPGALVRAAVRAANAEAGPAKMDGVTKAADAGASAEAIIAKPAAAAPALTALQGLPVMAMTAAGPGWSAGSYAAALQGEGEAAASEGGELSLDQALSRGEARADVQRHAAPQAAAHAAARFQPQTVQSLAARIAARAVEGGRVFDIRLDPAELGRVEVRLELGGDNSVRALLSAERADTLAELQRSARDLEKALAEAGLDLAEDGLSFSLGDDGAQPGEEEAGADFNAAAFGSAEALAEAPGPAPSGPVRQYGFELAARRGLDVRT